MIDPPRDEAKQAVARAKSAGIRPIMITGDHPKTASIIATELGIVDSGAKAVTGAELQKLSDADLGWDSSGGFRLCAGQSRAQIADCKSAASQWSNRRNDRGWRERRASPQNR